ncbi:hypothetical protein AGR7C_Lc100116 [Agrobacterium deltaense Zutra 3/1]|uniref:Uncharacterized protein n=1 Tax=Agrobacterium deltaense Zutra 3/1 TaxID=1183427 RepID=A0A1S7QS37_9HYPH|nr:hypothetical protein AGR7C_Lc100116 [Agrobacterium deltaense Zutra 3/1]
MWCGLKLGLPSPLSAKRDGNYSASGTYAEDVRFRPEAPNLSSPLIARHEPAFFAGAPGTAYVHSTFSCVVQRGEEPCPHIPEEFS